MVTFNALWHGIGQSNIWITIRTFSVERLILAIILLAVAITLLIYDIGLIFPPARGILRWLEHLVRGVKGPLIQTIIFSLVVLGFILSLATNIMPQHKTSLLTAANNTKRSDWQDRVIRADPGDVIEFKMRIFNGGEVSAINNVELQIEMESSATQTIKATAWIFSENGGAVSDQMLILTNDGSRQGLAYIPGHSVMFSEECKDGCALDDSTVLNGVHIGTLMFGQSVQVNWSAYVSNATASDDGTGPGFR